MRCLDTQTGADGHRGCDAPYDTTSGLGDGRALVHDLETPDGAARRLHLAAVRALDPIEDPLAVDRNEPLLELVGAAFAAVAGDQGGRAYRIGDVVYAVVIPDSAPTAAFAGPAIQAALAEIDPALSRGLLHAAVSVAAWSAEGPTALRVAFGQLRARSRWLPLSPARQARDVLLQLLTELRIDGPRASRGTGALHAVAVGRALDLPPGDLDEIVRAAELQDIGMLALPPAVLGGREELDAAEWELVRRHPLVGERIIGAAPALQPVARIVRSCYERYDGSGYPDGLAGDAIPLGARIIAPCVAFHAMTSPRPYRTPRSAAEALAELETCAGRQFDPQIVALFSRVLSSVPGDETPHP